jgi:small subunit ribosomal protein S1
VDVFGIEAFLPGSQIDVKPIRDYDQFVGKNMEFKVVKINQEFKNVVVSHKALIEAELEAQKKQIISGLEKGQVLEGTVKNITSYGVFVDLGGVDGLIHITDLSWGRVSHPEEVVQLDAKINVVILDFDDEKKRIALGLKQLSAHPWDALSAEMNVGDKVKGKVMVITDYGAFVEVAPGVEGLLHVSEMSWSQHLRSPKDFLKEGQEIECQILNIDREERKMSLGMKQLAADPWADIEFKYPVGSRHTAKVRNFTHFGIFAELEEGVDGLIHISDLSWTKRIKHPSDFCKIGDEVEVQVLEVDKDNRRLSLGHKQVEENPWDVFAGTFTVGSVHEGTLVSRNGNNFMVSLPYGVEGSVALKHLKKEDGSKANLEEKLPFKVLEFNGEARRIVLSHTRTFEEGDDSAELGTAAPKRAGRKSEEGAPGQSPSVKSVNEKVEKSTLGDLSVLSDLKSAMETNERTGKSRRKNNDEEEEGAE